MILSNGYDRRKVRAVAEFRRATLEDLVEGNSSQFVGVNGLVYDWRSNGAMKRWKREPKRFRLPAKVGFRECFAWVNGPEGTVVSESNFSVFPVVALTDWDK